MKLFAVDVGSGFTKGVTRNASDLQRVSMPSLVTPVPETTPFGIEEARIVTNRDGKAFLVGDDARAFGDPNARAMTLSTRWAGSEGWFALLYSMLDRLGAEGDIHLITGLPQRIFNDQKEVRDDLLARLEGEHEYRVNGETRTVRITPTVIPQAAGGLLKQAAIDERVLDAYTGVIDIGTYTTGVTVLMPSMTTFEAARSGGVETGTHNLMTEIHKYLADEYGYYADPADLPNLLQAGTFRYRGEVIDISGEFDRLALLAGREILDMLRETWRGGHDLSVWVTGGGAPWFLAAIRTVCPHAQRMEDSFWSVAEGMFGYMEARLSPGE